MITSSKRNRSCNQILRKQELAPNQLLQQLKQSDSEVQAEIITAKEKEHTNNIKKSTTPTCWLISIFNSHSNRLSCHYRSCNFLFIVFCEFKKRFFSVIPQTYTVSFVALNKSVQTSNGLDHQNTPEECLH